VSSDEESEAGTTEEDGSADGLVTEREEAGPKWEMLAENKRLCGYSFASNYGRKPVVWISSDWQRHPLSDHPSRDAGESRSSRAPGAATKRWPGHVSPQAAALRQRAFGGREVYVRLIALASRRSLICNLIQPECLRGRFISACLPGSTDIRYACPPAVDGVVGPELRSRGLQGTTSVVVFFAVQPIPRSVALLPPRSLSSKNSCC
jgi:hypothetical protein